MKDSNIKISFEDRILTVKFLDNTVIDVEDLMEVYDFATKRANGLRFGVMFEASGHYEVTESAISYLSSNPENKNVLAKVYVINTKEAEQKAKLHLLFDNATLKPYTFKSSVEGKNYLNEIIKKNI